MTRVVGGQILRVRRGDAIDEQALGIASRRRLQLQGIARESNNAKMSSSWCRNYQRVPFRRTERVVACFQPLQSNQGEPPIGLLKLLRLLRPPRQQLGLPGVSAGRVVGGVASNGNNE